jgi:hypothetical protein
LIALTTVTAEAANQRPLTPTFTPTGSGLQPGVPPPLTIKLPEGWRTTYTLVPFNDLTGTSSTLNLAAYAGSVSGGSGLGFIYILWNFPSVMPVNPRALPTSIADAQTATTLSDGYRLLRGTILDSTCLVNVYGQNYFGIGERKTIGQIFQTTACQDGRPDLVGWYTGVWEGNRHYLVFAWVEPPVAFNNGQADLQKILNTIQFVPVTPAPTPPPTTQSPAPTATPTLELS